jgi:tetratricopeptide (TPR) repeat protein
MISEELKLWRQRNNYSQGRLARALEVDVMTISRWERGIRAIPSFLHLALRSLEAKKKPKREYVEIESRIGRYSSMIKESPKEARLYIDRAVLYAYTGSYKEAFDDLDKAIEIDPKNPQGYVEKGVLYSRYMMRQYEKAIENFNKALEIDPRNSRIYFYRGMAYERLGKFEQALKDFEKARESVFSHHFEKDVDEKIKKYEKSQKGKKRDH